MNRNESFPAILVNTLAVRLSWASLDVQVEDVEQIQVLVSGGESEVNRLRITCQENRLTVEQPSCGLSLKSLGSERWMQVMIRLPRSWKGAVELHTISAPLNVRSLTGTDFKLSTVTGDMNISGLQCITAALCSLSGDVNAEDLQGEKLRLRSFSGDITGRACSFDTYRIATVSGQADLDALRPFTQLNGVTVSGNVRLFAPMDRVDAALRSFSGRLLTRNVSIQHEAPVARMSSISGHLEISCSTAAIYEEE